MSVRALLYGATDPYEKFNPLPAKVEGWGSDDPNFKTVIEAVKPNLIIEVGSWLGGSAIHMAGLSPSSEIVCVDTWLGSVEMWTDRTDDTRYGALGLQFGYPTIYRQFLSNIVHAGVQNVVTPFPQTSANAARWFLSKKIMADMIYLDASHEYEDILLDLRLYCPLVRPGGILFGDDWESFRTVALALDDFGVSWERVGRQWVIHR